MADRTNLPRPAAELSEDGVMAVQELSEREAAVRIVDEEENA